MNTYFTYVTEFVIPTYYDPNEFEMVNGRNLKDKFIKFRDFAKEIGKKYHSTDSTGAEGEHISSDVELYLKMAAEDEAISKSKTSENSKMRVVQTNIIGNQMPLFGSTNRSQVATNNKTDRNTNNNSVDVTSNLSSLGTITHQRPASIINTPIKRKKNCLQLHLLTLSLPNYY